jgi:hypothetical protein
MPTDFRSGSKKRKRLVGGSQETMPDRPSCVGGKIKGLVVQVLIGLRADQVVRTYLVRTHRLSLLLRRSSNRRRFSSQ